jgi:hypothetical protein
MTVQFSSTSDALKFAKKCLFVGCCANALYSNFYTAKFLTHLDQVQLDTQFTVEEMENILRDAKIKYNWVSQW